LKKKNKAVLVVTGKKKGGRGKNEGKMKQ